ncbi:MAG: hypothetical protein K8M05_25250 [Deltaproteobacteria bacterium]|nr:hypothetical protein [Kofleriaceae bacterium]
MGDDETMRFWIATVVLAGCGGGPEPPADASDADALVGTWSVSLGECTYFGPPPAGCDAFGLPYEMSAEVMHTGPMTASLTWRGFGGVTATHVGTVDVCLRVPAGDAAYPYDRYTLCPNADGSLTGTITFQIDPEIGQSNRWNLAFNR